jgi:raffinose/stachyose/melibiose transport system permease protein
MAQIPRRSQSFGYWYLFLIPLFAILAVVEFYPLLDGINLSLMNSNGSFSFTNYVTMLTDTAFWSAVIISLVYTIGSTALCIVIGLILTFLLVQGVRGRSFFEALYIFPLAVSPIVAGVLWSPSSVWDDIQTFLHFILNQPYFNELSIAFFFPVMILSEAWEWAPLIMLVALSILNTQASQVFEAAELHGASAWQRFTMIGLPTILRSPVMQFVIILRFIDAMRAFEIPLAWSNWVGYQNTVGSPVDTLSLFLYKLLFIPLYGFPIGLISAIAVALLAITLVFAFVLIRVLGRVLPITGAR